jgi:hypothetical protein
MDIPSLDAGWARRLTTDCLTPEEQ